MLTKRTMQKISTSEEQRQVIVTEIVRSGFRVGQSTTDIGTDIVGSIQTNLVAPEVEIPGIEVQGVWSPSNRSHTSNPSPETCSVQVITNSNRKICCCTTVHKPQVLERSVRYFWQQLRKDML
ncbi:hypothetical protein TNCV_2565001 [Trichonephila clavipes]|uniref:Uncharacterized protein n=1 Tax=Trichonephila clavipes TaxID=2585209 RepID=A0A8X6SAL6_TRICX|nr:hypothetical protein TNCV_2565001 [Trichonephila clavipes]